MSVLYLSYPTDAMYRSHKGNLMNLIKVSGTSRTAAVAGAIAGVIREHHRAEVQAIGAGAVNQAMKAVALATSYLKLDGIHVHCVPEFADVTIEGNVRTAIKLVVEPRDSSDVPTESTRLLSQLTPPPVIAKLDASD
jgi:stage V sporulation protein S